MSSNNNEKTPQKQQAPWQWTGSELKKALNVWDELSTKPGTAPDEQQLAELRVLFAKLKDQLEELDGTEETSPKS